MCCIALCAVPSLANNMFWIGRERVSGVVRVCVSEHYGRSPEAVEAAP